MSTSKLLVMSVITFGVYTLYWWYRQWEAVRVSENSQLMSAARAIFSAFFVYGFTRRIFADKAGLWAMGFYLILFFQLFVNLAAAKLGIAITVVGWFLQILWYVLVQEKINQHTLKAQPKAAINDRYSPINVFGIVLFVMLMGLLLLGAANHVPVS
jgi:hypothetical protein